MVGVLSGRRSGKCSGSLTETTQRLLNSRVLCPVISSDNLTDGPGGAVHPAWTESFSKDDGVDCQRNPGDNIRSTACWLMGPTSGDFPLEVHVETALRDQHSHKKNSIEGHSRPKIAVERHNGKGKEVGDADLKRPFKEALKTPLTGRIIEFADPGFKMLANIKLSARGWFENLSQGSIDGWAELRQQFTTRFSTRRACFKDPTEITKIVRKANETLVAFKERWIVETGFITGVPEVMKISSFMDAHKCPELAKQYSDKVPKMVDEAMTRLDDFVRSEEAFANTELPKGEMSEGSKRPAGPVSRREDRFHRGGYGADRRRNKGRNTFNPRDGLLPYRAPTPYQAPRDQGFHHPKFNLSSLTKLPKEILAT
ncbi:hypothetical protein Tco_1247865 [Tanacetum coccineum]